jgi:hypothetical protein
MMLKRLLVFLACLLATPALSQNWAGGPATGSGYPNNALPVTNSATGTTGTIVATLPAQTGYITFICGFVMTSGGTTAAVVANATIANTVSGTLNFAYVDVSTGQGVLGVAFPVCIPASAANTTIVVTMPAGGAGTTGANMAWGYQLRQ